MTSSADDDGREPAAPEVERAVRRHRVEWVVLAGSTVLALVFGVIGFTQIGWSFPDASYRAVQLFVLESGAVNRPLPAALEIARWLALAVAGYALLRAILVLFREQVQRVTMRFVMRDHVVIAGLGAKGYALAIALRRAGRSVVVVERDERAFRVASCRRRDIPVIIGDATDPALLARAVLDRASHFVVVTGEDRRNVEVAFAARRLSDRTPLSVLVHLDDLGLWRLLQAEAVAKRARLRLRLDFFNLRETSARAMLECHPPFGEQRVDGLREPHVLIVESEQLGESVLLRTAGAWQATRVADEELLISMAGPGATSALADLRAREPALDRICRVDALDAQPVTIGAAIRSDGTTPAGRRPITAVYVCMSSEAEALAVALALHGRPALAEIPIVVAVADEHSGISLALQSDEIEYVRPFGLLARTLTASLLDQGTSEALARAKHEHYVQCELGRGTPAEGNPSMVPWSLLEEALKESNRRFADSIGKKLESAACAIVPAPLADPAAPGFEFGWIEVEELARAEHDRWRHDLEIDGWRFGGSKDPVAKRHPKLLAWEELTEEDRDKDREPVRALPGMLARAGFQIQRGRAPGVVAELHRRNAAAAEVHDELPTYPGG